jgi:hypothetical protein
MMELLKQISEATGIPLSALQGSRATPKTKPWRIAFVKECRRRGMSYRAIAKALKQTKSTIHRLDEYPTHLLEPLRVPHTPK